jgi:hypothetical protein
VDDCDRFRRSFEAFDASSQLVREKAVIVVQKCDEGGRCSSDPSIPSRCRATSRLLAHQDETIDVQLGRWVRPIVDDHDFDAIHALVQHALHGCLQLPGSVMGRDDHAHARWNRRHGSLLGSPRR